MKLHYYPETDTLYIQLKNEPSTESEEIAHDVVIDFDANGKIVGIDIDHASQAVDLSELNIESLAETLERPNQEATQLKAGYYFLGRGTIQSALSQGARRRRQTNPEMVKLARQILGDAQSSKAARKLAASVLSQQASTRTRSPRLRRDSE
uniref:DUF2283 domain-containing protein n=1 Tax=Trichocoleus desertorum TaxID=1481672 RepID=UPI0025B47379|nr:DUF2283 domain-containing protein [Trichocoleus desertorum]